MHLTKLTNILKSNLWHILILLVTLPTLVALTPKGYFGASDDIHIAWLYEMDQTIKTGQIPPRFVPDLSYGFGYPLFNFVFPLPYYVGELVHLVGINFVDSIKIVMALSTLASAYFMFCLVRRFTDRGWALIGTAIYVYSPYRATDLYIRGALGEIVAFAFLPLITLALVNLTSESDKRINLKWIGIGAIAICGLILSHDIAAFMAMPFLLLLASLRIFISKEKRLLIGRTFLSVSLGVASSGYFWLPAIVESSLMKYSTVFNFQDHYPTIKQLITPYFGYGASVAGPYDGMSFFLGVANILFMILGGFIALSMWKRISKSLKIFFLWLIVSLLFCVFMMNFRSAFLWLNIPLITYFQFPWRFLIMTSFLSSLFVVFLYKLRVGTLAKIILLILICTLTLSNFRPQDFLGRTDNYFLDRYIPYPAATSEYRKTGEEYLRLPKDQIMRPETNYSLVFSDNVIIKSYIQKTRLETLAYVSAKVPGIVSFNKYYFPGWMAELDGVNVPIKIGQPFAQISIDVPPGEHSLKIHFKETSFRYAFDIVSLLAIALSLLFVLGRFDRYEKNND